MTLLHLVVTLVRWWFTGWAIVVAVFFGAWLWVFLIGAL